MELEPAKGRSTGLLHAVTAVDEKRGIVGLQLREQCFRRRRSRVYTPLCCGARSAARPARWIERTGVRDAGTASR